MRKLTTSTNAQTHGHLKKGEYKQKQQRKKGGVNENHRPRPHLYLRADDQDTERPLRRRFDSDEHRGDKALYAHSGLNQKAR
jgi:hypothetical protein